MPDEKLIAKIELSERDEQLLDIYSDLVPFVMFGTDGRSWYIKTTEGDIEFKTYKSFIKFVEEEIKESLLTYVLNGEFDDLIGLWK